MRELIREDLRELTSDEIESVSGGGQYPAGWPDGVGSGGMGGTRPPIVIPIIFLH